MQRIEAGEAEPGLVPEEDQVGFDRQALLHHHPRVVHVPVEGAVGHVDDLDPVERAFGHAVEQRLLDRAQRHRAVHRVLRQRERLDVIGLRAAEHEAVVVRLVAVAVDDDDVARLAHRLHHDLVRGRGAVGAQVGALGAERPRHRFLRALDGAGGLEQAVEAAGGGGGFREQDVGAVELAHVADPVGREHRLAARDRQRMEGADRTLRILLQVVEVRRLVAVLEAVEDRQVQFHRFFDVVEQAPDRLGFVARGQQLRCAVGEQVEIELGTQVVDGLAPASSPARRARRSRRRP